ncbi:hypothetical protein ABE44_14100 [Bacillus thuringiensis]|uniref:hemolysin XhlA family protein n=1 Tax=Bacillus thuringiensis TaxID=1428 RepID=UPI0018CDA644|nr:hemolysin XhlA family protein [Bacillus thuringiensis]MBG9500174.1 hypothetical protein [Bacillus thuringiensis]
MPDLHAKINRLRTEQKEMASDIQNLEKRTTINEKDISIINNQLEKVCSNTTWILRIVMSAIIIAILGLIIKL